MDLRDAFQTLRRRWISAAVVVLLVLAATAAGTFLLTPRYEATTRLFFAVQGTDSATDLAQGSTFAEKQMTSYAEVATSPLVLGPVISKLGLDLTPAQLALSVTANVPLDTVILEVTARTPMRRARQPWPTRSEIGWRPSLRLCRLNGAMGQTLSEQRS